jgi:DNA-binding XRE family transcriptional regulator
VKLFLRAINPYGKLFKSLLINTTLGSHYDKALFWLLAATQAENLDLTQQKLAEQVGYSAAAILKLEVEERRPFTQLVERLAELFAIHVRENRKAGSYEFVTKSWLIYW